MKEKIKEFFEKLAKANEEEFGNKRLDCCEVGRKENTNKKSKDREKQTNVK